MIIDFTPEYTSATAASLITNYQGSIASAITSAIISMAAAKHHAQRKQASDKAFLGRAKNNQAEIDRLMAQNETIKIINDRRGSPGWNVLSNQEGDALLSDFSITMNEKKISTLKSQMTVANKIKNPQSNSELRKMILFGKQRGRGR